MTDKKTEALKLALEALEIAAEGGGVNFYAYVKDIREALAEQPAQQRTDYAWPTLADYERDVGFQTNEAFRAAWNMARTTNKMLGFSEPQPAQDQGQSCYCPECERLSKELAALKAQQHEPVAFLANGTRFKMSFFENEDEPGTHVTCFEAFEKELDGRWVALVPAEDDSHLKLTSPPPRKPWVGLTDWEREKLRSEADDADAGYSQIIKATEAKLREKNT